MDNTFTFSGLDLVGAVFYGRSTPFPQLRQASLRLAHKAGNKEAVRRVFPWRASNHALWITCQKQQATATD